MLDAHQEVCADLADSPSIHRLFVTIGRPLMRNMM